MRIWDLPPCILCRQHLLGEHRELHAIWRILVDDKDGYSKHPETCRWRGKRNALYDRHRKLVNEMERRGFNHESPLDQAEATGKTDQTEFVDLPEKQERILKQKDCPCFQQREENETN